MRYEQFTVGQIIRGGINNGTVTVLEVDDSGYISKCKCATGSIPSATAGYAIGCELIDTTTGKIYTNQNTAASCTFNAIGDITSAELADSIDLGASGTAGDLDIFPATASKGKLTISATNSVGDTTTTVTNASQSGARTYTIPDAGASASFVMTGSAAQTITGNLTVSGTLTNGAYTQTANNIDAGASGAAGTIDIFPTTASRGKTQLTVTDNVGDTTTTINTAAQAGARTYTVPDAGASASFVMTEVAQTINGVKTFGSALKNAANVGTANSGVTAVEYGDGFNHTTVLTVSKVDAIDVADDAALADGYLLYTLPAGAVIVDSAYMSMAVTLAEDTTATADVGLGTTIGAGANATLNLVAAGAAENLLTGQTAADCNGTATVKTVATQLVIEAAGDHTIYFNIADTWANTAGADLTGNIAGTVVLSWRFLA